MNNNDKKLIRKAIKILKLLNISLYESHLSRPNNLPDDNDDFGYMTKTVVEFDSEDKQDANILFIKIGCGVRLIKPKDVDDDTHNDHVYVEIEADFFVSYEITSPLDNDHMRAFSESNGVHNIWPFWRQHVFDLVQRGNLPPIEIPLFSGENQ